MRRSLIEAARSPWRKLRSTNSTGWTETHLSRLSATFSSMRHGSPRPPINARPFPSLNALYEAMTAAVRGAGDARQMTLINGHPDLAGKAAREGTITAELQARAVERRARPTLGGRICRVPPAQQRLSRQSSTCPSSSACAGTARNRSCASSSNALRNDGATERDAALTEIFRIVALRLDQRVTAPDRLKVHGRLSTHVLDTHARMPGVGCRDRIFRSRIVGRAASHLANDHQCRWPHRSPAYCGATNSDRPVRVAVWHRRVFCATRQRQSPIHPFSASFRSGSRSRSPRLIIMYRSCHAVELLTYRGS